MPKIKSSGENFYTINATQLSEFLFAYGQEYASFKNIAPDNFSRDGIERQITSKRGMESMRAFNKPDVYLCTSIDRMQLDDRFQIALDFAEQGKIKISGALGKPDELIQAALRQAGIPMVSNLGGQREQRR